MKYKVLEKYTDEVINREDDDGNVVVEVTEIWMRVDIDGEEKNLYLYREEYFDEEGDGKGDSVEYGLSKQFKDRYSYVEREGEWVDENHPTYKVFEDISNKLEEVFGDRWDIYSFGDGVTNIEGEI